MDSLNSLLDFTKICRLCLSQGCHLSNIFSDMPDVVIPQSSLASKILACVAIEVEPGDNLPEKICNRCIEQLENWIKFKEFCDYSNTFLLQCAAGVASLSDELLQTNLHGNTSEGLDIPETSSDFCFEDVSLLEHDSLFQKFDYSGHQDLPGSETIVPDSFSKLLSESCNDFSKPYNDEELKKEAEEDVKKESNKLKYREKYASIYCKRYTCGVCPNTFPSFHRLLQHDRVDHKEVVCGETCITCGKLFISKLRLQVHDNLKHKEKNFVCDVCGMKSVSEKSLKVHKLRHSKKFVCDICGMATNTHSALQDHIRVHSDERMYTCDICQQAFKQRQSLRHHIKTHDNDSKPDYKCNICSRTFKTFNYLKKHKTSHTEENSTVICEVCGHSFKNKTTLYIHKLSHEKKQVCIICNKVFSTKNLLSRHMIIHQARPFVCSVCDKSFNRADTLSMHLKTHYTPSKYFFCQHCNQSFTLNKYLKRHLARIHDK